MNSTERRSSLYRHRISYPSPVRAERRYFDGLPTSSSVTPRSPRFVPRRSLGDLQVTSATASLESSSVGAGESGMGGGDRPGLFGFSRQRSTPRANSPIPFATPLLRQRPSPSFARRRPAQPEPSPARSTAPGPDSAYNSAADLHGHPLSDRSHDSTLGLPTSSALLAQFLGLRDGMAAATSTPKPSPEEPQPPASPLPSAPQLSPLVLDPPQTPSDGGLLADHQYQIRQLERRLGELESEIRRGGSALSGEAAPTTPGAEEEWRQRRRRLGQPAPFGSTSSLGGGSLQDEPLPCPPAIHRPSTFRANPLFAMSRSYAGPTAAEEDDEAQTPTDEGRLEVERLSARLRSSQKDLALSRAAEEEARTSAASQSAELESLRARVAELESECGRWAGSVAELKEALSQAKASEERLRRELVEERSKPTCELLDATPEPVWPPSVRVEQLEEELAAKEDLVATLQRRLQALGSSPARLGGYFGAAEAAELTAARAGVTALGETMRALAERREPKLDALFGEPEAPVRDQATGDVKEETRRLRAEVEDLAEWLRETYYADDAQPCTLS